MTRRTTYLENGNRYAFRKRTASRAACQAVYTAADADKRAVAEDRAAAWDDAAAWDAAAWDAAPWGRAAA